MTIAPTIIGAACTFPSGPCIELADTAVRAQLSMMRRHPDYADSAGANPRASFFPVEMPFNAERWGALAYTALAQLLARLEQLQAAAMPNAPCMLWLVLPDSVARPGLPADLKERVLASIQDAPWQWQNIEICSGGHAAGVTALERATQALTVKPDALAVVLAIESGLSSEALMWLDMQSLLHGSHQPVAGGFRMQPHGRVPGEGAAAIALAGRAVHARNGWARLLGCGTAEEPITRAVAKPCTGVGLTQAAKAALVQAGRHGAELIGYITADLNGEPYRADQFGFTALRLGKALKPDWQRVVPALASGDLGTASAIAHIALAAYAIHKRPEKNHHLILASSDDTLRGAVVLGPIHPQPELPHILPWRSPSTSMA